MDAERKSERLMDCGTKNYEDGMWQAVLPELNSCRANGDRQQWGTDQLRGCAVVVVIIIVIIIVVVVVVVEPAADVALCIHIHEFDVRSGRM